MSTALNPIPPKRYTRFVFNGQEEHILSVPDERDGDITFTMGGKKEHATTLPLEEFEAQTGYYLLGLEPSYEFDASEVLSDFGEMLIQSDYKLDDLSKRENQPYETHHMLLSGVIQYATKTNTHVISQVTVMETDSAYQIHLSKAAGGSTRREVISGHKDSLPLLLEQSIAIAEKFANTRVQIMSKDVERGERKIAKDGTPVLFENESIDQYFASQNMPAGIVMNNAGNYQAFASSSYGKHRPLEFFDKDGNPNVRSDVTSGRRFFDYDTKDFKTAKSAEKFLAKKGFGPDGKFIATIDPEEFKEGFHTYNAHTGFVDSSHSENTCEFGMPEGHAEIGQLTGFVDEELGQLYKLDFNYIDELSGKTYNRTFNIEVREPGAAISEATQCLHAFVRNLKAIYEPESDITFDKDERTIAEKREYHTERVKALKAELSQTEGRAKKYYTDEGRPIPKTWSDLIEKRQKVIEQHKFLFASGDNQIGQTNNVQSEQSKDKARDNSDYEF